MVNIHMELAADPKAKLRSIRSEQLSTEPAGLSQKDRRLYPELAASGSAPSNSTEPWENGKRGQLLGWGRSCCGKWEMRTLGEPQSL